MSVTTKRPDGRDNTEPRAYRSGDEVGRDGIDQLATYLLKPDRPPVVVVSPAADTGRPRLDVAALIDAVGQDAIVLRLATMAIAKALSVRVPIEMRVYGGATRLYWPDGEDSRLFLTFAPTDSPATIRALTAELRAGPPQERG